ncbi:hypothetical protein [Buchnera aphidicola]|uniref:hypothetical protein n=1 Tax=Buchnera aphidicola TaxID=9 RepID=UPI0034640DB0
MLEIKKKINLLSSIKSEKDINNKEKKIEKRKIPNKKINIYLNHNNNKTKLKKTRNLDIIKNNEKENSKKNIIFYTINKKNIKNEKIRKIEKIFETNFKKVNSSIFKK